MSNTAISVSNVSKCYHVFDDVHSRLLHAVWPAHTKGMQDVWALKDINFEIKRGESAAIIGCNGSGKSTLLEILTGTLTPTTGSVTVNGRVSALLELGSGFNPEYSGRANVIVNGLLLGLSKNDIVSRFGEIEAFAEIGAAIDRPVKTYSSGMMMRLAFAVQVLCDPDILIIDEALSVGDFFFQQKCFSFIRGLCAKGTTLLFVSHDMQTVRDFCGKGLYLEEGVVGFWGDKLQAINCYLNTFAKISTAPPKRVLDSLAMDQGSIQSEWLPRLLNPIWRIPAPAGPKCILAVGLYSPSGECVTSVRIGERIDIYVQYLDCPDDPCHITCLLRNRFGNIVTTFGTYTSGVSLSRGKGPERILKFSITAMIESGQYSLQVNLAQVENCSYGRILFQTEWVGPVTVSWNYQEDIPPFYGLVGIPVSIVYC